MTRILTMVAVALAVGCGDDAVSLVDASIDASAPDASNVTEVAPPDAPSLAPCPEGWRTVEGNPPTCDPWPETGRSSCADGEAHFPGAPGCSPIGDPCPDAGGYPTDLPAIGEIRYVRDGAPPGGDGSADAPFATITEALAVRGRTTIALAEGVYEESVSLYTGVALIGACAARTRIEAPAPSFLREGVVSVYGEGAILRNVTLAGPREGLVVRADGGGSIEVRGVFVEGALASGVSVFPENALTGSEVVVREIAVADAKWGYGIAVAESATASLSRVVVEGATSSAVSVLGEIEISDVALVDTRAQPLDGRFGAAVAALNGARAVIARAALEAAHDHALVVSEPGTQVTLEDSVIRATRPRVSDDGSGHGAFVFDGAALDLTRVHVSGSREAAILATDPGSHVTLRHVVIEGTRGRASDGGGGSAIALQAGAAADLAQTLLDDSRGVALFLSSGSSVSLVDVTVRATGSEESDGRFGHGLHVQGGSAVDGERVWVDGSRSSGITALGAGSMVRLVDARVSDTRERECAATTCPELGFGDGVLSSLDATIDFERFVVEGSARAGVHVANGLMDLRQGSIVGNAIGAAIQTPGFDVARISDGVIFADNGRNVDMTSLPLPEPTVEY